jgi:hypothetical protein
MYVEKENEQRSFGEQTRCKETILKTWKQMGDIKIDTQEMGW